MKIRNALTDETTELWLRCTQRACKSQALPGYISRSERTRQQCLTVHHCKWQWCLCSCWPIQLVSTFPTRQSCYLADTLRIAFVLGTTESLRKAFTAAPSGSTIVYYTPTVSLPLPTPVSHIVFNSAENYLILGAASGGLAIYSVDTLGSSNGQVAPLFEVGTNGLALREVKPNPNPDYAKSVAIVTQNGEVRMLDLDQRRFVPGKQGGDVLKSEVSTIAWSQRGKQLICGLTNGSCSQITPEGDERAVIPKPPNLTDYYGIFPTRCIEFIS